jgi:hypothetical protein
MADIPDQGPASSYSDPIYDRLEPVYEFMRKRVGMFLLAILFVIVLAVIVHLWVSNRPDAASAAAYAAADRERDKDARTNAFKALAADGTATDYYRARAGIELTQIALEANDPNNPTAAMSAAKEALARAGHVTDPDLLSAARMSVAACEDAGGDFEGALKDYDAAATTAGAKLRANHLQAVVGAANALIALKRPDEAISRLEPLLANTDKGAEQLMDAVRTLYWTLKRNQAGGMGTATGAAPAGDAKATAAAAAAVEATAAAVAPVVLPTAPVPATPALPAPPVQASATPAGH